MGKEYDIFILQVLSDIVEDEEGKFIVRDLTTGTHKYKQMSVKAMLSHDAAKYPDTLRLRQGKGQLVPDPWSIKIIKVLNMLPDKYLN